MQVKIGKIVNTQGIKGEVRILSNSDFKDERFKEGAIITVKNKRESEQLKIEKSHAYKSFMIVKFTRFDNINQVLKYKNYDVFADEISRDMLMEDEYLNSDIVGCSILDQDYVTLGVVSDIIDNPAHNLLRVDREDKKSFLVPFKDIFLIDVNINDKKIVINNMPGLIDED